MADQGRRSGEVNSDHPLWWDSRGSMLFDVLVTLGCLLALVTFTGIPDEHPLGLSALAVLTICVLLSLATVVRRRWPTALGLAAAVGVPSLGFQPVLVVCLYSWARYSRSRRGLVVLCAAAVVLRTTAYAALYEPGLTIDMVVGHLLYEGVSVGGPVLLGVYMRSRRLVLENLRDEAERLEREQRLLAWQTRMEERARIAREMHDVVAHRVSLMSIHAGAVEVTDGVPAQAAESARLVGEIGRQALDELRQILAVLRTEEEAEAAPRTPQPTLDDLPTLVEQSRTAGMQVDLAVSGSRQPLDPSCERTAYRLVQEALTNALKHAGSAATRVHLRYQPDALCLVVDNECPTMPASAHLPSGGHGLAGLRERVTVLGGSFEAGPRTDGGFRVSAVLPTKEAHYDRARPAGR